MHKNIAIAIAIAIAVSLGVLLAAPVSASEPQPAATQETAAAQSLQQYLFDAARAGESDVLRQLIAAGIDVDARDARGSTALILAAYYGHAAAVDALLQAGADPNLGDAARSNTALMGALFMGHEDAARRLLADPRMDVNARNGAGQTAAMFAALFGRDALVEALAVRGADFGLADARGETAEGLARKQGNEVLAQALAERVLQR